MALGRPRDFDPDRALDQAMEVFWNKGYEGASLSDLTEAMGINRPSLYAAFGNKEELFRKVLERYISGPVAFFNEALSCKTSREVASALFQGTIDLLSDPHRPKGCLMVQSALTCGSSAEAVRDALIASRSAGETKLRKRFERAKSEGDLPGDGNPADLAKFVSSVLHGLSVQAAGGAKRQELQRVADLALQIWG